MSFLNNLFQKEKTSDKVFSSDILLGLLYFENNRYDTLTTKDLMECYSYLEDKEFIIPFLIDLKILKKVNDTHFFLNFDNKIVSNFFTYREELEEFFLKNIKKYGIVDTESEV